MVKFRTRRPALRARGSESVVNRRGGWVCVSAVARMLAGGFVVLGAAALLLSSVPADHSGKPAAERDELSRAGQPPPIYELSYCAADGTALARRQGGTVELLDVGAGGAGRELVLPRENACCASRSLDGRTTVVAYHDGAVLVDRGGSGALDALRNGGDVPLTAAAVCADGRWIAGGDAGGAVHVWGGSPDVPARVYRWQSGPIKSLAFSDDSRQLAATGIDDTVAVWDLGTDAVAGRLDSIGTQVITIAFAPDGRRLLTGHADGRLLSRDIGTGRTLWTMSESLGWVTSLAFSEDGRTLAVGCQDGVAVHDVASRERLATLTGHVGCVRVVRFLGEDELLTASFDGTVRVWDLRTGAEARCVY